MQLQKGGMSDCMKYKMDPSPSDPSDFSVFLTMRWKTDLLDAIRIEPHTCDGQDEESMDRGPSHSPHRRAGE